MAGYKSHADFPFRRWCMGLFACLLLCSTAMAQEICDNGIDDDGNGLIDLNDTLACPCDLVPVTDNLITNGSFEDHNCCPQGISQNPNTYLDCATGWTDYMTTATADYFGCNFMPNGLPQPLPDGNFAAGFLALTDWAGNNSYYEFLAQCLDAPLLAGQNYKLDFNIAAAYIGSTIPMGMNVTEPINFGPIDLVIYGLDTCPPFTYEFIDPVWGNLLPAVYCPTELGFTPLGSITYDPVNAWQEVSFTFTPPFNVGAILFGPACPIPADYISQNSYDPYFFVDNMSLDPVILTITRQGHPCTNNLVLTAAPYDVPPNAYQWYLNGVAIVGQTGETLDASALDLGEGTYSVRMIKPDGSCTLAQQEVVVEYPQPLVQAVPATGCAPLNTVLTNLTDPSLSGTLLWDLGDGSTSGTATVNHTYTNPGSYDVRLTVTSAMGCTTDSLFEDLVVVASVPTASFTTDTTTGCVGTEVQFTNTSTPPANYTCTWSFGDGAIEQGNCSPTHAYQNPGTYNVMLQVVNDFGCQDDHTISQYITILPTPTPAFSLEPDTGCVPLNVRFNNETSQTGPLSSFWDLGNGQTDTAFSTAATYTTPGSYTVSLTMTNELGCSATLIDSNAVTAYGIPQVTFFVEPDTGCAPLEVQFNNTTDPGMIGGCTWAFGDGSGSADCQVQHTYTDPGTYTVSLTVTSPAGCEGDTTLYHLVQVNPSPTAGFTHAPWPTDFYHPHISFEDRSTSDAISWQWTFPMGDPPSSTLQHPQSTFPGDNGGTYPVELVVANQYGCTDTLVRDIVIDGVFSVYVPNAFTPNGDGANDLFMPIVRDEADRDYDLRVFDRWGTEVFHADRPGQGWDGRVKGEEPVTGVYVWKLHLRSGVDRLSRQYVGHVTVLP